MRTAANWAVRNAPRYLSQHMTSYSLGSVAAYLTLLLFVGPYSWGATISAIAMTWAAVYVAFGAVEVVRRAVEAKVFKVHLHGTASPSFTTGHDKLD